MSATEKHRIRVRGDDSLLEGMTDLGPGRGGLMRVTARRHRIEVGSAVRLEISFGALSDEILLDGVVEAVHPDEGAFEIEIVADHAERFDYVRAVLAKERAPVVRRYRRVEYRAGVIWRHGDRVHRGRIADLSCGGVFVVDPSPPARGDHVELRLELDDLHVEVSAEVTWTGTARGDAGFGVRFQRLEREEFELIRGIVAAREQGEP